MMELSFMIKKGEYEVMTREITSTDGTTIGYRQLGSGPGLVIVHGGLRASQHYLYLARALSEEYTVTIPDRRGRGLSGNYGDNYSIQSEVEDLTTLLFETGAKFLFGHSSGGLIALETALIQPVTELAVYEPPLSINGSVPRDWLTSFQQALNNNDPKSALLIASKGLGLISHQQHRENHSNDEDREKIRETLSLVPTFIKDMQLVTELESKQDRYQNMEAETLLLGGDQSPAFLRDALISLENIIPNSKQIILPRLMHNAPDDAAPELIASILQENF
jgi:pimeloyl-ACP methyl ester carboxylesterase